MPPAPALSVDGRTFRLDGGYGLSRRSRRAAAVPDSSLNPSQGLGGASAKSEVGSSVSLVSALPGYYLKEEMRTGAFKGINRKLLLVISGWEIKIRLELAPSILQVAEGVIPSYVFLRGIALNTEILGAKGSFPP